MKLVSYFAPTGQASYGVTDGERVFDLARRYGADAPDLKTAIQRADLAATADAAMRDAPDYELEALTLLPVIPNPGKIVCVGLNYKAHREETNREDTPDPTLFLRVPSSQTAHHMPLICPAESDAFDFEGEIAIVMKRGGRRIPQSEALSYIAGFSCYNDGSVRDIQHATPQWTSGKNFPETGAFGPWLVTTDELPPDRGVDIVTRLNGMEVQRSNTSLLTFPYARLISFISTVMGLEAGDVIVTGTPGGVGAKRNPPLFMKNGDMVEVEVEGIGTLRNKVVKELLP